MNIFRSASLHQRRMLSRIASGYTIIRWDSDSGGFVKADRYYFDRLGEFYGFARDRQRKPSEPSGAHELKAFVVLMQRGWLARDESGHVVLSGAARRAFETRCRSETAVGRLVMSRTRAARVLP